MLSPKSRFRLSTLPLLLLPILVQSCLGSMRYLSIPRVQTAVHADIWNFSDRAIDPDAVDELYLEVARLMAITPDSSKPCPQVLVVSPDQIHQEYLRLRPSAMTQDGIALALYIAPNDQILIPRFDRTLLAHELVHYFTFHYLSVARSQWEAIADRVMDAGRMTQ